MKQVLVHAYVSIMFHHFKNTTTNIYTRILHILYVFFALKEADNDLMIENIYIYY